MTTCPPLKPPRALHAVTGAALLGAALALAAAAAPAQTVVGTSGVQQAEVDPPGRVARLGYFDGSVSQLQPGESDWRAAQLNYPVAAGDRLATQDGGRAELHLGSTALRLAGRTQVEFTTLDDDRAFITLSEGTLALRVRQLFPGQHLEVNTGNLAFSITQPGDYRVDVDPASATTRVTVADGGGVAYGENGQTQVIGAPQQIRFNGRNLAQSSAQNGAPRDAFDQWAAARDRQEDASVSARYVSREMPGYQALDSNGEWATDATLGPVWYPRVTVANWAPYRYGHWTWVAPWGWTWVDDAPWGFAPFHYGRWAQVGPRWAWVPGPRVPRPVYAPAVVGFVGGTSGGVSWNISIGGGRQPGVGWFPLAPGEAYRPAYRASPTYVTNINRTVVINRNVTNVYRYQRPDTVTALPAEDFRRGRPTRGEFRTVAQADLERARVTERPDVRPPPRAERNDRDDRRDDRRDGRPGGPPPFAQRPDARPDGRLGSRVDPRPDNRPDNRPDERFAQRPERPSTGQPAPDLAEQQRRRIERAEDRNGGSLTMEQRQQLQQRNDAERRALAEQQQRQLQDGALRQQQEQQQRVQRQQQEQQDRVRRQQDDLQDRIRQQQRDQQDRMQRQQHSLMEQQQQQRRQADEQRAQQDRAQRDQQEQQARRAQMEQQQRQQAEHQQRQQMEQQRAAQQVQQREAQRQQQDAQRAQMEQQRQQEDGQRAQREQQQREQAARAGRPPGGEGRPEGRPNRPDRPDRRDERGG